jgi:ubiquitin C-terminal hydrolase
MTDIYKNKGLTGLANLGNTCFINTIMQILSHTYDLNNFLNKESYKKYLSNSPEGKLLHEWNELRKLMWSRNCTINPIGWVKAVQSTAGKKNRDLFTGFAQNDLSEFLRFIIDCFHESIKRPVNMKISGISEGELDDMAIKCYTMMKNMYNKEYSEILSLFYGIQVSEICSLETSESLSITPEPYFLIELPIPENLNRNKSINLYDCFDIYSEKEELKGENAWFNETTQKKENITKNMLFWNFPDILVLALKRFDNFNKKKQTFVDFPIDNLNISKYVRGYNKHEYVYDLYGIANHTGGSMGGHYFAYVKTANDKWYCFNDTRVTEIDSNNLEHEIITQKAYVFFYRKKKL